MIDTITDTDSTQAAPPADKPSTSVIAQLARSAVSGPLGRVSDILTATADTIDGLLGGNASPLPDAAKGFVTSTSSKLRELSDRATEDEAAKLITSLQQTAASHPAATAGIGAALGAALGIALAKLGTGETKSSDKPKKRDE